MEPESHSESRATERGLLDLSVAQSTRDITAGNQFALFVLVRNPFNKPVWIRRVHVSLPSELKLADPSALGKKEETNQNQKERDATKEFEQQLNEKKETEKKKEHLDKERERLEAKFDILSRRLEEILSESSGNFSGETEDRLRRLEALISRLKKEIEYLSEDDSLSGSTLNMSGEPQIGTLRIDSNFNGAANIDGMPTIGYLDLYNSDQVLKETTQTRTIELESSLPTYAALQPGSTAVYTALLYVRNSIIFTPSQYRLHFNVNYSFKLPNLRGSKKINQVRASKSLRQEITDRFIEEEEELFTNTVPHEISIRPSVYSIMLGSIIGGSVGSLARILQIDPSLSWSSFTSADFVVGISVSVILSAIAIVFMARKSDTQSFLSIEDFWGGLLIGFLIGYTGASFFQELTGIVNPS